MTLFRARKDADGYHYLIWLDETKPVMLNGAPDPDNTRRFDFARLPTGNERGRIWTEAQWIQSHRDEMRAILTAAGVGASTALPVEGVAL